MSQKHRPLVLASGSPRRKALLEEAGYRFKAISPPVEEVAPPHLTVRETVLLNARNKGVPVAARHPNACVLAADTLVSLEGRALGKPANLKEARSMLRELAGRTHQVFSGVWVTGGGRTASFVAVSHVRFRTLTDIEIRDYTRIVQVLDKAGAYAAQEDPIGLIEEIVGSRTNVIGLPMEQLKAVLPKLMRIA